MADAHHGERSSELAVCKLLELFRLGFEDETEPRDEDILLFLTNAIVRCHTAIMSDLKVDRSMTNLVTAVRKGSRLYWASVSDAFLFRADAGQIGQINRDLGHGIGGRRLSVWLGHKRFRKGLIDSGSETLHNASFLLATDGIMKHPRLRLQSLVGQLNGKAAGCPGLPHHVGLCDFRTGQYGIYYPQRTARVRGG